MDRPTVARWREIASLLVAGSLLASTLAPAVVVSAAPLPPTTGGLTALTGPAPPPLVASDLGVAEPASTSILASRTDHGATPRKLPDPPQSAPREEPSPVCAAAPATAQPATVVRSGPRDEKVVALTFDDGWDPVNTMQILGTLEQLRVNATFFPVGSAVQSLPGVWQAVAGAGFPIGDHSYNHPHLAGLCFEDQLSQLTRPEGIIRDVLGIEPFDVMRPPYGAYDQETQLAANVAGDAAVVLWDVDTRDWSGISRWAIAKRALAGHEGSIILMHTFVAATAAALPGIIAVYRTRGYRFVTVGQLLGLGGPVPYP